MEGFIFTIFVILTLPFVFAGNGMLWVMGYNVTGDAQRVAEQIVEKDGSPRECLDIRFFSNVMGPTVSAVQNNCIYEYAKLAKDPSACEFLMPSDYGWSCVGAVEQQLFSGRLCTRSGALDHIKVYCNRESEDEILIDRPQIEDCLLYSRTDLREWCFNARTELIENVYDCPHITRDVMRDFCEYNYALKMRSPDLCMSVRNPERRAFCDTRVNLTTKYRK